MIKDTVAQLCKDNGITVKALCRMSGVNVSTVYNWDNKHRPTVQTLSKIAPYLNTTGWDIMFPEYRDSKYFMANGRPITKLHDKVLAIVCTYSGGIRTLSDSIGVSVDNIASIIRHEIDPYLRVLDSIARTCDIPLPILLDDQAPMSRSYTSDEVNAYSLRNIKYNMRLLRVYHGYNLIELAGLAGANATWLGGVERGEVVIARRPTLECLADSLGVNISDMVGDYTRSTEIHRWFCSMPDYRRFELFAALKREPLRALFQFFGNRSAYVNLKGSGIPINVDILRELSVHFGVDLELFRVTDPAMIEGLSLIGSEM